MPFCFGQSWLEAAGFKDLVKKWIDLQEEGWAGNRLAEKLETAQG